MKVNESMKAAELRREYQRQWRRKNPEKVKKYNKDYWMRKAELESRELMSCREERPYAAE